MSPLKQCLWGSIIGLITGSIFAGILWVMPDMSSPEIKTTYQEPDRQDTWSEVCFLLRDDEVKMYVKD